MMMGNAQGNVNANLRYMDVMARLRRCGYDSKRHPLFCEVLVNAYGLLPDISKPEILDIINPGLLSHAVQTVLPPRAVLDGLILLDCLVEMVRMDGGLMFMP